MTGASTAIVSVWNKCISKIEWKTLFGYWNNAQKVWNSLMKFYSFWKTCWFKQEVVCAEARQLKRTRIISWTGLLLNIAVLSQPLQTIFRAIEMRWSYTVLRENCGKAQASLVVDIEKDCTAHWNEKMRKRHVCIFLDKNYCTLNLVHFLSVCFKKSWLFRYDLCPCSYSTAWTFFRAPCHISLTLDGDF